MEANWSFMGISQMIAIRLVCVESPYKATNEHSIEQHRSYLQQCLADCVKRQESPYASHMMLTDVLDDDDPVERAFGIKAGWEWGIMAEAIVVYGDLGISEGMKRSIEYYESFNIPIERRTIDFKIVRDILGM